MERRFLTKFKILLRFVPAFVTVVIVILTIILEKQGMALLALIFGGLISAAQVIKAFQMINNLFYLQNQKLYELMVEETPQNSDTDYAITKTFIFSYKNRLCLPILDIQGYELQMVRYVNSAAKSRGVLTLYMKDGDKYEFLRYSGLTENQVYILRSCISELCKRNPDIKMCNGKS